ncbi:MAG: hypothetical protein NUV50_10865 [Rhodospirillales bacterium]|nr:hypothetical protein [Rhodospirillales bacterium]
MRINKSLNEVINMPTMELNEILEKLPSKILIQLPEPSIMNHPVYRQRAIAEVERRKNMTKWLQTGAIVTAALTTPLIQFTLYAPL